MQLKYSLQLASASAPMIVLVHGRAFDMTAMKVFERVLPDNASRLYLQAPFEDPEGGYCWWNMFSKQSPDSGLEVLLGDLRECKSSLGIAPIRTVGIGFSQGAAMLSGVLQRMPEAFNAVALLAGMVLEYGEALPGNAPDGRCGDSSPEVLMIHGSLDERVPIAKARHGADYLSSRGYRVEFVENEVGHKVGAQGMRRLKEWLGEHLG